VQALYSKEGKVFTDTVEGAWEDRLEQYPEELLFIPEWTTSPLPTPPPQVNPQEF